FSTSYTRLPHIKVSLAPTPKVGQDSGSSDPNDPEERHNSASHTIGHTIIPGLFCRDDCSSAGRSLLHTRSLADYPQRRRGKCDHHLYHNRRNSEHCLHISVHEDEAWGRWPSLR